MPCYIIGLLLLCFDWTLVEIVYYYYYFHYWNFLTNWIELNYDNFTPRPRRVCPSNGTFLDELIQLFIPFVASPLHLSLKRCVFVEILPSLVWNFCPAERSFRVDLCFETVRWKYILSCVCDEPSKLNWPSTSRFADEWLEVAGFGWRWFLPFCSVDYELT